MAQELYPNRFSLLELDWHEERKLTAELQVDATEIDPRVIYRSLHDQGSRSAASWRKTNDYTKAITAIDKAVAQATAQINAMRDASAKATRQPGDGKVVDAVSTAAGKAVEMGLGGLGAGPFGKPVGQVAETLTKYGARFLPQSLEALASRLSPSTLDLLKDADAQIARSMGDTLKKAAVNRPIIIMFDTYEIIDELDAFMRLTIKTAGPRVAWVIAGRRELYGTRTNTPRGRADGYREEDRFSYDVLPISVDALALEHIREYFKQAAPNRPPLTDDELRDVDRATAAIPLAIRLAADIWRDTGEVTNIVSQEGTTAKRIVDEMVGRFLQHCVDREDDRRTLAAIALAQGDARLLEAMLLTEHGDVQQYTEQLRPGRKITSAFCAAW
jgi:hypothetical protein